LFGGCLGFVWVLFGIVWVVFGCCLGVVWVLFRWCLGVVWVLFGWCLGGVWVLFLGGAIRPFWILVEFGENSKIRRHFF
jgi:hypothetical protein